MATGSISGRLYNADLTPYRGTQGNTQGAEVVAWRRTSQGYEIADTVTIFPGGTFTFFALSPDRHRLQFLTEGTQEFWPDA